MEAGHERKSRQHAFLLITASAALALSFLLLLACSQQQAAFEAEQGINSELLNLESLQAFSETFNSDTGKPRLLLLLSPT